MLESYYGPPLYSSLYTDNVDLVHSLLREAYRDQIDEYMANTGTGGGNKVVNSGNTYLQPRGYIRSNIKPKSFTNIYS